VPDLKHDTASLCEILEPLFFNSWTVEEVSGFILELDLPYQDYVLNWVLLVAKTHPEIAYQFAKNAKQALNVLGREGSEQWLQKSLDVFFAEGLFPAVQIIKRLDEYIVQKQQFQRGILLNDARGILQNFLNGLGGRTLNIQTSDDIYTDSEHIYLPEVIDYFEAKSDNFACYKAVVAHLWAQNWYGTWRVNIALLDDLDRFHYLETLRLNACLARDFPGLWREMHRLHHLSSQSNNTEPDWLEVIKRLSSKKARVGDSLALMTSTKDLPLPVSFCYQGLLKPEAVEAMKNQRILREKNQLQLQLSKIAKRLGALDGEASSAEDDTQKSPHFTLKPPNPDQKINTIRELELDGIAIPPDSEANNLMTSIIQDLGEIPPGYLVTGDAEYFHASHKAEDNLQESESIYQEKTAHLYDEWDYTHKAHRKRWCALREKAIVADYSSSFVDDTLHKYRAQIKTLRHSFEALRDDYQILKKQPDGENLDIDALVESISDLRSGMEMTSRIYRKAKRVKRNIAVVFMVDMSASTRGWINTAQREALILLTEALQALDDRYAIYGFSSMTRKRCDIYKIKSFDEQYDSEIKARIAAIEPQDYTRMGVTIRHLSALLESVNARSKLLITLTDGKPDDYDSYHGEYGIEDTRIALLEARQSGIHPFCITIDKQARDYLPHMYGDSNYVVIDDVAKLPYRISEVYRGLTS